METINIAWYAIPNGNTRVGGFLPLIEVNGKARGDTWAAKGHDRYEALEIAHRRAENEASKYIGDWRVAVSSYRAVVLTPSLTVSRKS